MGRQAVYSKEFKREAVRRVLLEEHKPIVEIARELGIKPGRLYQWRAQYLLETEPEDRPAESLEQEVERLRRELGRVREEREILKKAVEFFAREPR